MESVKLSKRTKRRFSRRKYLEYRKNKRKIIMVKVSVFLLAFTIFLGVNILDSGLNARVNDDVNHREVRLLEN